MKVTPIGPVRPATLLRVDTTSAPADRRSGNQGQKGAGAPSEKKPAPKAFEDYLTGRS